MKKNLLLKNVFYVDGLTVKKSSILIQDQIIVAIGPQLKAKEVIDFKFQKLITPGLIDCHTHLIFAGNRAHELAMRLQGASYAEIAKAGGGILSTVQATRDCSEKKLIELAIPRFDHLLKNGVTHVEIKSGYGLDLETEIKILTAAKKLAKKLPITIHPTFLGAHAIPPEFKHRSDDYVDYVCKKMIPKIAQLKLATSIDAFCESIAFSTRQVKKIFQTAQHYHLPVKLHAEQLSHQGGAALATEFNALSVDHLEYLKISDVKLMQKKQTVAVLLPSAFYFLREKKLPPLTALRKYQIPIAIASDYNPGTSPFLSMPLVMNMACVMMGLTMEEAFLGATLNAAKALRIEKNYGSIEVGKNADFAIWNTDHYHDIIYRPTEDLCVGVIKDGSLHLNNM